MPALVIGHHRDPVHPFSDAGMLTGELPNARLVEASTSSRFACDPNGSPPRSADSSRNAGRRGRSRSRAGSAAAPPDDRLAAAMSQTAAPRPRVLSGIQPNFQLHLGNYLGALRNWAQEQERYDNYFCIVDLHALTTCPEPERGAQQRPRARRRCSSPAASTPTRSCSSCSRTCPRTPSSAGSSSATRRCGWLERMTQFKAEGGRRGASASVPPPACSPTRR